MPNFSEQRKHPRVQADFSTIAKALRKTQFEGKILSLSEGGAFLATDEKLSMGSEVVLFMTLNIPGSRKSCIAQGKVAWANSDRGRGAVGCGIAFEVPSSAMRKLIREFVAYKTTGKVTALGVAEDVKSLRAKGRGQLRG